MNSAEKPHRNTNFSVSSVLRRFPVFRISKPFLSKFITASEGFACAVDEYYRSACEGLDFYGEYEGKRYCVLHFPGEKKDDFRKVVESKLAQKDYDFSGTIFPEGSANFFGTRLDGESTSFFGAQFSGKANFAQAQFGGEETSFLTAQFGGEQADFRAAQFRSEKTTFIWAKFSGIETTFQAATFAQEVDFREATFKERVAFWGTTATLVFGLRAWARFHGSRIEKPELFIFNNVLLHPGWFINTDVRKVDFTDVKWYGMPGGPEGTLDTEIKEIEKREVQSPHTLLAQACRRLSANAEENREYPLANEFHYWSMNALRKEGLRRFGLIRTAYWALSGYGVRAARAFVALLIIWVVFTTLYVIVPSSPFSVWTRSEIKTTGGYSLGAPIQHTHVLVPLHWPSEFGKAAIYSLGAIARLRPEPQPDVAGWFQLLVTTEGIVGPLQIALLALAIRRKVMR